MLFSERLKVLVASKPHFAAEGSHTPTGKAMRALAPFPGPPKFDVGPWKWWPTIDLLA